MDRLSGNAFIYVNEPFRLGGDGLCRSAPLDRPIALPDRVTRHAGGRGRYFIRWLIGVTAVLVHGVAVLALMLGVSLPKPQGASSMVMIDLSSVELSSTEPKPVPKLLLKDARPLFVSVPQPFAISIDLPQSAPSAASVVRAPDSSQSVSSVKAEWAARVLQHLERFKRYPREAAAQHAQGIASLHFSVDRSGTVLRARIDRSAGYDLLDEAALALVRQATPLPPPPQQLEGEVFDLVVPITFSLAP